MKRLFVPFGIILLTLTTHSLEAYLVWGSGWPLDHLSIQYYINEDGDPYCAYGDEFLAVEKGIQAWTEVSTSKIEFVYMGKTEKMPDKGTKNRDTYNVVGWIQSGWTTLGPKFTSNTPAVASVLRYYEGGPLKSVDMFFNGEYWNWSAKPENSCPSNCYDVQSIAAHEAGHWIDLNDLPGGMNDEATMSGSAYCGDVRFRTLHSDDIAGASFLYPYEAQWPGQMQGVSIDNPHTLNVDVALSWNPEEESEYFHLACQEGNQFETFFPDSAIPFDSRVSPVRVVYCNNGTAGWSTREILSPDFELIYGPQLELDQANNAHIIWTESEDGIGDVIYRKRSNGSWYMGFVLSSDANSLHDPTIAVPNSAGPHFGNIYTAWVEKKLYNGALTDHLMFRRCVNGTWQDPVELTFVPAGFQISSPQLAIDSTGGVHIAYRHANTIAWIKNANKGEGDNTAWANSAWKNEDVFGTPSIAIDGYGNIHIVYTQNTSFEVKYVRIPTLGNGVSHWDPAWEMDNISPYGVKAHNPQVRCDNLGFVHFFWGDNRNYPGEYNYDIFYRRNLHMGDPGDFESDKRIYELRNVHYLQLGDVAQPDTFGDLFVGIDAFRTPDNNWDTYATRARQDDGVRSFPWPPGPEAPFQTVAEPTIEPQSCYLKSQVNKVLYFASEDSELCCYSVDGRRVLRERIKGVGELELLTLPSGIYFAQLRTDGDIRSAKVLVIR